MSPLIHTSPRPTSTRVSKPLLFCLEDVEEVEDTVVNQVDGDVQQVQMPPSNFNLNAAHPISSSNTYHSSHALPCAELVPVQASNNLAQFATHGEVPKPRYARHPYIPGSTMPFPEEDAAPKFDGTSGMLTRFFRHINLLASRCGLSDEEKIRWTFEYVDQSTEDLWRLYIKNVNYNWEAFKRKIMELYPGSDGEKMFSHLTLNRIVKQQRGKELTRVSQLGEYLRNFLTVAQYLVDRNLLTDREAATSFFKGFTPKFRKLVHKQLRRVKPTHDMYHPWTFSQVYKAALYLLSNRDVPAMDSDSDEENNINHLSLNQILYPDAWNSVAPQFYQSAGQEDEKEDRKVEMPGVKRLSHLDLNCIVKQQQQKELAGLDDLGEYYRTFLRVAGYLIEQNLLTDREAALAFFKGFTPKFRKQVREQMRLVEPRHDMYDPWEFSQVYDAALYMLTPDYYGHVLSSDSDSEDHNDLSMNQIMYPDSRNSATPKVGYQSIGKKEKKTGNKKNRRSMSIRN